MVIKVDLIQLKKSRGIVEVVQMKKMKESKGNLIEGCGSNRI